MDSIGRTVAVVVVLAFLGQCPSKPDRVFLLPDDTYGWFKVEFNVKGAPSFPRSDGQIVVSVPLSGRVATSDPIPLGESWDEFRYQSGGQVTKTNSFTETNTITNMVTLFIFAGTRSESKASGFPGPNYEPQAVPPLGLHRRK